MAMIESIRSPLTDLAKDYGEIGLDSIIKDEVVTSIPIVNTVVKLGSAVVAVRDLLFARKVCGFLLELKDTNQQKRIEFVHKLGGERQKAKAGSILLDLLDKTDGEEKAAIIGALVRAAIQGELSTRDAFHIAFMVNQSHVLDLIFLKRLSELDPKSRWTKVADVSELDPEAEASIQRLAAIGLVRVRPSTIIDDNLAEEWQIATAGVRVVENALREIEFSTVYEHI